MTIRTGTGRTVAAEVALTIDTSQPSTTVETNTAGGRGFFSQGYAEVIPATGYDEWREAAVRGVEIAMKEANVTGLVVITKIAGWSTDTTPARMAQAAKTAVRNALGKS